MKFTQMFAATLASLMLGRTPLSRSAGRRTGKPTSKCHHGPAGPAGSKLARLAAEKRIGIRQAV